MKYLKKGDDFCDIELITRSKLINDYYSVDFAILESLSSEDYELWRSQFKDVDIRIK